MGSSKGKSRGKKGDKRAISKLSTGLVGTVLLGIAELVVGVLLIVNPTGFTGLIVTAFGLVLIVLGVIDIVKYFRAAPAQAMTQQNLAKGLAMLILGGFCLFQFRWITAAMPLMSTVYGVAIVLLGVVKTQWAVDLLRLKRAYWYIGGIGAALSLGLGAAVIANPFATADIMWGFIALTFIVAAVLDVVAAVKSPKMKPVVVSNGSSGKVTVTPSCAEGGSELQDKLAAAQQEAVSVVNEPSDVDTAPDADVESAPKVIPAVQPAAQPAEAPAPAEAPTPAESPAPADQPAPVDQPASTDQPAPADQHTPTANPAD